MNSDELLIFLNYSHTINITYLFTDNLLGIQIGIKSFSYLNAYENSEIKTNHSIEAM